MQRQRVKSKEKRRESELTKETKRYRKRYI